MRIGVMGTGNIANVDRKVIFCGGLGWGLKYPEEIEKI